MAWSQHPDELLYRAWPGARNLPACTWRAHARAMAERRHPLEDPTHGKSRRLSARALSLSIRRSGRLPFHLWFSVETWRRSVASTSLTLSTQRGSVADCRLRCRPGVGAGGRAGGGGGANRPAGGRTVSIFSMGFSFKNRGQYCDRVGRGIRFNRSPRHRILSRNMTINFHRNILCATAALDGVVVKGRLHP